MQRPCYECPDWHELTGGMTRDETELKALMILAQKGDSGAYTALLAIVQRHLFLFFRRRLSGDSDRAGDLVQETLMAIHAKRHTFNPDQNFTSWVYAIARYKLVDAYRRGRIRAYEPLDEETSSLDGNPDLDAALARADLEKLMQSLPARQRSAINLTRVEGLSHAEAARRLGATESTLKMSVHRGLKAVRRRLRQSEGGRDDKAD